ncbi:MAG TPA: hypothetical protein VL992_13720 [Tepidisphaeraceae bacterium]|nr:hypothetical protein [Tepidisphaeraceae bacterium]
MADERAQQNLALAIGVALCLVFVLLAWSSVKQKSATADEPNHVVTGWFMLWRHDYRISPDVPPLWEDWIGLGLGPNALQYDASAAQYRFATININMGGWCDRLLYHTPGNDGIALVNRARAMCLIVGVALAVLIGGWAWQIGGAVAAVTATFCYVFDPNFLGHAPLAKNDVAAALMFAAASYAVWLAGRRLDFLTLASVALLTAAAVAVKFSGILLAPVLILTLLLRAVSSQPWPFFSRVLTHRSHKLLAAAVVWIAAFVVTIAMLWACYDFRFDAGPDGMVLDSSRFVDRLRSSQLRQHLHRDPTPAEVAAWRAPLLTRIVLYCEQHHLLPQAFTSGFIHTQNEDQGRHQAYLMGTDYRGGRWYYFPLAFVVKEPLAMLAMLALTIGTGAIAACRALKSADHRWTAIALAVPFGVYALAALTAEVNIGLRHAFPVFPFIFIAAGLGAARLFHSNGGRIALSILGVALIVETASAFPNYIAFMNVASVNTMNPPLSDSNLDWGQDLPLLARWQRHHSQPPLYLDFFGHCDPAAYGIHYIALPDGYCYGQTPTMPTQPGTVAISATILMQLRHNDPAKLKQMGITPSRPPDKVLGKTIYLYSYPPPEGSIG